MCVANLKWNWRKRTEVSLQNSVERWRNAKYYPNPRMMNDHEWKHSVEWMARETELLEENLSQSLFVHHKSHVAWPGIESGPPLWEAGDYPPELWHSLS
jgi:hypothetical protein